MSNKENPLAIAAEVLTDWLSEEGISEKLVSEESAAVLFMLLGTAGYSIVPNATAEAGQGWVSVKERLPEPDPSDKYLSSTPVLIHLAKGPQEVALITKAFYSHQGQCWEHCLSPMGWGCK